MTVRILKQTIGLLTLILLMGCESKQKQAKDVGQTTKKVEQESTKPSNSKTKTILCFGNSLTAGFGLDENQAWPALLQNRIDSLDLSYQVVNAGISGETTSNGISRLDWVLRQEIDVFILELGANDMLRGLDVKQTEQNLESIIKQVKGKYPDVKVVVAGMLAPPNMGKTYVDSYNKLFPTIAEKYNAALIPFFLENVAAISELNLADGKHPNVAGQKIVLENVWEVLKPIL